MARKKFDKTTPFQSPSGASHLTGFSTASIRRGCKEGTIPHVRVGKDYRINMRVWLEQLNAQSMTHISEGGN